MIMPSLSTISYPRMSNRLIALRNRERNLVSGLLSLLGVVLLSASLGDEEWFYLKGGHCPLNHIGMNLFYEWGYFSKVYSNDANNQVRSHTVYKIGSKSYVDCVTPGIADLFHGTMGVLFVALSTLLTACLFNIIGVKQGFFRWLRRNSVFNIFSVIMCSVVICLIYWISVQIEDQQRGSVVRTQGDEDLTDAELQSRVEVSFEDGFYLILGAGLLAVCAVAADLLRATWQIKRTTEDRLSLMNHGYEPSPNASCTDVRTTTDAFDGRNTFGLPPELLMHVPPPPPPYAP